MSRKSANERLSEYKISLIGIVCSFYYRILNFCQHNLYYRDPPTGLSGALTGPLRLTNQGPRTWVEISQKVSQDYRMS